jgi:hypothetical protein
LDLYRLVALLLLYCPAGTDWVPCPGWFPDEVWIWVEIEADRAGAHDPATECGPMAWKYAEGDGSEIGDYDDNCYCRDDDQRRALEEGFLYLVRRRLRGDPHPADPCYRKYSKKATVKYAWR